MDWDKLKIFHAVAQAGSFTEASGTLNLSQFATGGKKHPAINKNILI